MILLTQNVKTYFDQKDDEADVQPAFEKDVLSPSEIYAIVRLAGAVENNYVY